jgi:DNA-binding NarL/FixJ family response regulator
VPGSSLTLTAPARPRVLLADDHIDFLETVSRHLGGAFDVVATAPDGRQALDLARRLRPDVAVLDVSMPDLNGLQTLEQLRRDGLDTKVVFLTMHSENDFVSAAINGGAHGYVLKSRIHLDLIGAIHHALAGRLCLPSMRSLSTIVGSRHAVHFHDNEGDFLDELSQLIRATLLSGEPLVLVSSEATRLGVAQRLQGRQMDLAVLAEQQQYVAMDSALALSHVMRAGRPDKERVAELIHSLERVRQAVPSRPPGRLTIVGDMSPSLYRNGDFEAALELERIWNDLTRALPFFTVCIYPIDGVENPEARNLLSRVCAVHTAVTSGASRSARAT